MCAYKRYLYLTYGNTTRKTYEKLINTGYLQGRSKNMSSNFSSKDLPQENKLACGGSL